jgi:hypothetical protein
MGEVEACDVFLQFRSVDNADDTELDRLARRLNVELQQVDIEAALAPNAETEGTRVAMGAAIGSVAVKIAPTLLPMLIERIRHFLTRSRNRTIKVNVRIGKNAVDVEYPSDNPVSTSDIANLVKTLSASVDS